MSVYARPLLIAGAALAIAMPIAMMAFPGAFAPSAVMTIGVIAAAAIGLGLGLSSARKAEREEPRPISRPAPEMPAAADTGRIEEPDVDEDEALTFAHQLVEATTSEHARLTIARYLPPLVGTRRLWITTYFGGRRQVIVPEAPDGTRQKPLLRDEVQEWTTFPMRIDDAVIGVIGVEARDLSQPVRRRIQQVAPLIGRVLRNAEAVDRLRETSLVDLLTGAATRGEGLSRLRSEIKRAQRTGSPMAVLMLDLDQFKILNDRFGHATGDEVLTAVGRTMLRTLRASDIRCRWGGEEFLVVLPETDVARAEVVAGGLLRNIAATTVPTFAGPVGSTVSIGLTTSLPGEIDVNAIVHRADVALYRAKDAGRGCVRVVLQNEDTHPAETPPPSSHHTLRFPERRNPDQTDRRGAPSPGRRSTDPRSESNSTQEDAAILGTRQVRTSLP